MVSLLELKSSSKKLIWAFILFAVCLTLLSGMSVAETDDTRIAFVSEIIDSAVSNVESLEQIIAHAEEYGYTSADKVQIDSARYALTYLCDGKSPFSLLVSESGNWETILISYQTDPAILSDKTIKYDTYFLNQLIDVIQDRNLTEIDIKDYFSEDQQPLIYRAWSANGILLFIQGNAENGYNSSGMLSITIFHHVD